MAFYSALLGWTYEQASETPPYWIVRNGERGNGGVRPLTEQEAGIPSNWIPYFGADSTDETASAAADAGGSVLAPPFDLPAGRVAVLQDPHGAAFAVFQGEFED
jgi:predicted enzyme related to lactoylglutathione lyase